jgi:hypothetical protein
MLRLYSLRIQSLEPLGTATTFHYKETKEKLDCFFFLDIGLPRTLRKAENDPC